MATYTIARVIIGLTNAYSWIIVIYCLLTWIPMGTGIIGDIKRILEKVVDPVLKPFRKIIPPIGGMVDISPIVALLVLQLVVRLIIGLL